MSQAPVSAEHPPASRPARAGFYLHLLWLIPGAAMLAVGLYRYRNVPEGGIVRSVQLVTKPGLVGQASEAYQLIRPGTPDLYLKLFATGRDEPIRLPTYKDRPVGSGLTWALQEPLSVAEIKGVEVWDEDLLRDGIEDQVTINPGTWSAEGQKYRIDLHGERNQPPPWALPVACIGGAIAGYAVLRFVWDQVI